MTARKIILSAIASPLVFIYIFIFPALPSLVGAARLKIKSELLPRGSGMILWRDYSANSKSWRGIGIHKQDGKIIVHKIKTPRSYPFGVRLQQTIRGVLLSDELSGKWTHNAICYIRAIEFQEDEDDYERIPFDISIVAQYEYIVPLLEPMTAENKRVILFYLVKCFFLHPLL